MECTRLVSHVYAGSSILRPQRPSLRHMDRMIALPRVQRSSFRPTAVAAFVEPASVGSSSTAAAPTTEEQSAVIDISSDDSFNQILASNPDKLIVLMCKANGCRPCKQFRPKYVNLANLYPDAIFCEVIGDRNDTTRNLMRSLKVRATPSFLFHRNQEMIHSHSGINGQKMVDAFKEVGLDSAPAAAMFAAAEES